MDRTDFSRYSRQMMLDGFGSSGQQRLAQASVLVVGLGGLGAPVCAYLAGAGIGRIGLCDNDTVSLSNLHRQLLYTEDQTGTPKTSAAAGRLSAANTDILLETWPDGINPENAADIISHYGIVVDCCDNFATRFLLDDTCHLLGRPWVFGSIDGQYGQVALMGGSRGAAYDGLFGSRDSLCATPPAKPGVLGPAAGTIGSIQAATAIQWMAGLQCPLDGRLFSIDLSTFQTQLIDIT